MRYLALLVALTLPLTVAWGQAPESASLWRVAAAVLAVPPALEAGPVAVAWNPAGTPSRERLSVAVQVIHTSAELGLSGIVAEVSTAVAAASTVGLVVGRLDVRDLVRTTTTPTAVGGSIPVYTQYAGVAGGTGYGPVYLGALLRLHDERFDLATENGLTFDLGARVQMSRRLVVAAATHFLPIDLRRHTTTDYYVGVEYELVSATSIGVTTAKVTGRYGATYRSAEALEHGVSLGVSLANILRLDAAVTREVGFERSALRTGMAVSLRAGRYLMEVARSSGLNDLGATYRIGIDAVILR
ncbi:MAG: hypothetical protein AMS18_08745 [Gemmatimonas sp. SG8_17]|nr:MAG: hypothetical protein AMS18_08745 [Gemmatimonas sp. SG8_17]